jgi:tRNA modification GTPase
LLIDHLKACVSYQPQAGGEFIARRRHLDALEQAQVHLRQGAAMLIEQRAGELLAEDLRQAQQSLSEITGEFGADDLLGRIFSTFCIGK